MLAALMAIWAAVFCAHALAFRAGNPLLALLPPVMLVAFADTVLQESFRPGYGVLFLIGALAVVLVDGLRRVQQWGPVWTFGVRRRAISGSTVGRAWRVSGSVIVVAALAPLFLPGLGGRALIDISGPPGSNAIRIDPQVEIASRLTSHNQQALFTVKTTTPTYYRMLGLDEFDGNAWTVDLN